MPLLAGLFTSLIASLGGFFGAIFTARVSLALAALIASAALLATLTAAITGALGVVVYAMPVHPMVTTGLWLGIPDNGPACLAFCLMVDAAVAVYQIGMNKIWLTIAAGT